MPRKYELKRRAERQQETRRRIVEAAIELHSTVGPARTTVSAIAERAGVQRHTFYKHFPEELDIQLACSGLHMERHPPPDPEAWRAIADPRERVRAALRDVWAYYEEHEQLLANVFRDMQVHDVSRQATERRMGPWQARTAQVLAAPFRARGRRAQRLAAALELALSFATWQLLVRRHGLRTEDAIEIAVAGLP